MDNQYPQGFEDLSNKDVFGEQPNYDVTHVVSNPNNIYDNKEGEDNMNNNVKFEIEHNVTWGYQNVRFKVTDIPDMKSYLEWSNWCRIEHEKQYNMLVEKYPEANAKKPTQSNSNYNKPTNNYGNSNNNYNNTPTNTNIAQKCRCGGMMNPTGRKSKKGTQEIKCACGQFKWV